MLLLEDKNETAVKLISKIHGRQLNEKEEQSIREKIHSQEIVTFNDGYSWNISVKFAELQERKFRKFLYDDSYTENLAKKLRG